MPEKSICREKKREIERGAEEEKDGDTGRDKVKDGRQGDIM